MNPTLISVAILGFVIWVCMREDRPTIKNPINKKVQREKLKYKRGPLAARLRKAPKITRDIVKLANEGLSIAKIAKKLKLSKSSVYETMISYRVTRATLLEEKEYLKKF